MFAWEGFDDAVGADRLGGGAHPVHRFTAGRVCAQTGCTTLLSIYNEDDRCARHGFAHVSAGAERRPAKKIEHTHRTSAA